jgi:hypothetical protein
MDNSPISNPFDEDEKRGRRPIIWAALGLIAMCLGVSFVAAIYYFQPDAKSLISQYFPSSTPPPTSTPAPTATPNWTATAQIQDALSAAEDATNNWELVLADTFDNNDNIWLAESSDDEYALINYEIVDGKYRWDATAHQSFIGWARSNTDPLTDFYLSVEITQVDAPDTADYGVLFREDEDSNFYYFAISEQGLYAFYIYFEGWDTLIDWTKTPLIIPGTSNRITVIGEGSHFTFFINDQYLTDFTDDQIPEGLTSLAVELSDEGDQAVFEFDNFELRIP